jgi:hypothetical protein
MVKVFVVIVVVVVFVVSVTGNVEVLSFVAVIWLLVCPQRTKA